MSIAYLTPKGQVVKGTGTDVQSSQNSEYVIINEKFDAGGQLIEFSLNTENLSTDENRYIFVDNSHYYLKEHRRNGRTGYLKKSYFIKLKNNPIDTYQLINDPNNISDLWFDVHFQSASEGDLFHIEKVVIKESTLNTYYTFLKQSFKIKNNNNVDYDDDETYPKNVNSDSTSPDYNIIETTDVKRLNFEEGNFFSKNFDPIRTSTTIQLSSKLELYRKLIDICFAMYWTRKEVLDILAIKPIGEIENAVKAKTIDDKNGNEYVFSLIDRTIGRLLIDWGYKDKASVKLLVPQPDNDYFYEGYYTAFENYENGLNNFYHNLREKKENEMFPGGSDNTNDWQSYARIKVLKQILPVSAIAILPYQLREDIIDDYIRAYESYSSKTDHIDYGDSRISDLSRTDPFTSKDQEQALAVMHSFYQTKEDRESFLKYLLKLRGKDTNFVVLMNMFFAARIMRIAPIIGFFIRQRNYRMNFVFMVYKLWEKSQYNFFYYPDINDSIDNSMINANSYFFKDGFKYFDYNDKKVSNYTVYFGVTWKSNPSTDFYDVVTSNYTKRLYTDILLDGKLVKTTFSDYLYETTTRPGEDKEIKVTKQHAMNMNLVLHLYQPIALQGYQIDPELKPSFPPLHQVPAFLWYYSRDYEIIKEFDAGYNLALGIAFDVGLFFITGGTGNLITAFRHLRSLTLIGRALGVKEGAQVFVAFLFESAGAGAEAVAVTSSACARYYDFMIANADNETEAKKYEEMNKMFFYITLLAAGASLSFRALAVKQARLIQGTTYYNTLLSQIEYKVLKETIDNIAGTLQNAVIVFRDTKINTFEEITSKFDNWSDVKKTAFFEDFGNLADDALKQLNTTKTVANWEKLHAENIADRKIISVIIDDIKTEDFIYYYEAYRLKVSLSAMTSARRFNFVEEFQNGTLLQKNDFRVDFQLANSWEKFRFEPNLIDEYKKLSIDEKINWFKSSGTINAISMEHLKMHPKTFNNWKNLSLEDKLLFKNSPDTYIQSIYQFDDFIFFRRFSPVEIPTIARDIPSVKPAGYLQVEFRFTENGHKWEVRAHTEIPNSPGVGNGDVWVVKRQIISDGTFQPYQEFLSNDEWIRGNVWFGLIDKQKNGTITEAEKSILKNGHFKVK